MAKTREIKGRIRAVKNIQRITKTMQMIATARFQAALKRAVASQPYSRKISALVRELANKAGQSASHPLLREVSGADRTGRELLLVISSNRGLCGAYNANVLREVMRSRARLADRDLAIDVVGKKAVAFFKFNAVAVNQVHTQFGDNPPYEAVEALAEKYMEAFASGQYDAIHVAYMRYESASRQTPHVLQLLPLRDPASESGSTGGGSSTVYDYSPSPQMLLDSLLPVMVKTQLFQCFNEAVVSEQIGRMVAMKAATDAASKLGKALTRKFNRARQGAITTELSEIISGAASLK